AFSNALLGITHSLAHKIGAVFDIPHGCCNAILLPYVIKFNSKVAMKEYAEIAKLLGLPGASDKQLTDSLIAAVDELNKKVDIVPTFKEYGVTEDLLKSSIDAIAKNAVLDPCTASNPRKTTEEDMKKILECAYYGKQVNF